jgi:hypothetical protein
MVICDRLRELRESQNLSQGELPALLLGTQSCRPFCS